MTRDIGHLKTRDYFTTEKPEGCPFNVGDRVTFTNDYGLTFGPYRVLGFDRFPRYGRLVFVDKESYWMPCAIEQLKGAA